MTHESELLDGIRIEDEELRKIIVRNNTFLLKYTDGRKINACVLLEQQGDELYLGMLTVSPALQAMDIGKKLLQAADVRSFYEESITSHFIPKHYKDL